MTIPDLDPALRIATKHTSERYLREHDRMSALAKEFGLEPANAMNVAKTLKDHDDTDFHLVIQAAHYFANHDCHTMRKAICQLTGQDTLTIQERPIELRLRLMDAEHHDQPDLIVTQPWVRSQPTDIEHAICILGNGYAATSHITTLLPWLTTIPNIIYWGDMDAHGLDILSKLRATGIPCTSILMDTTAYRTYEQYGTQFDAKNKPLTTQTPQPTPGLTTEERKLYETLCTGTDIQYLRIEQERIPIRDATTILHDQHHWPIDIPGNDIPNNNTK